MPEDLGILVLHHPDPRVDPQPDRLVVLVVQGLATVMMMMMSENNLHASANDPESAKLKIMVVATVHNLCRPSGEAELYV